MKKIYIIISALLLLVIITSSVIAVCSDDLSSEISEDLSSEDNGSEETSEESSGRRGWIGLGLQEEFEYAPEGYIFKVSINLHPNTAGLEEALLANPFDPSRYEGEIYTEENLYWFEVQWRSEIREQVVRQNRDAFIEPYLDIIDIEATQQMALINNSFVAFCDKETIMEFVAMPEVNVIHLAQDYESPFEKKPKPAPEPEPTDMTPAQIGDVNGDKRMDSLDAALMLKYDAGIIEYVPVSEPLDMPDTETVDRIRNDYWTNYLGNELGAPGKWETTIDDVRISKYYGNVNGYEIVFMEDNYPEQPAYQTVWVGNHGFRYGVIKEAFAYKDGQFYTFKEAYDAGYLTNDDIYTLGTRMPLEWKGATYDGVIMGDCNFDRQLNSLDAAWVLKYDAKLVEYSCYTGNYGDMDMGP
ncbi:MAG: hypothetical protein E7597_00410 [Ruminococcaceae bacterium]|nr:hypothetical protein [Oscillospiraceae bacterium]